MTFDLDFTFDLSALTPLKKKKKKKKKRFIGAKMSFCKVSFENKTGGH